MSKGLNEAWLVEILDEDEVSLSRQTFDDIVNRLNEQDEKIRQLADQRAELLDDIGRLLDKKDLQAALSQESTSPYSKGAGSAIEVFAAEVRTAIANATQQRNATGGAG